MTRKVFDEGLNHMPVCDQVQLLIGPFDDGELEPHEMEDVALHVVTCPGCKSALEDYRRLGVALRDCVRQPALNDFTEAVLKRVERLPVPLSRRISRRVEGLAERIGAGFALTAAATFAAIVSVLVVTPYARTLLGHGSSPVRQASSSSSVQPRVVAANNPRAMAAGGDFEPFVWPAQPFPNPPNASLSSDDSPMIAVSEDPTTTVIWVPDQP